MTINTKEFWKKYDGTPIKENASASATSSGSVATVSMPLGGTISRGGSLLSPRATDEEFPNTPDWMKQFKDKSQNNKAKK
jgi:hypothetical protein